MMRSSNHALWAGSLEIFGVMVSTDKKWSLKHVSDNYMQHLPYRSMLIFDSKFFGCQLFSILFPVAWLGTDQTFTLFTIFAI